MSVYPFELLAPIFVDAIYKSFPVFSINTAASNLHGRRRSLVSDMTYNVKCVEWDVKPY